MGNCECVRLKGNSLKTQNYLDLNAVSHCAHLRLSELQENALWSYSTQAELKLHRIHAYPAKFPAFITTRALDFAQDEGLRVRLLADIFCGCGTVAFEARRNSIDFWGCDINPVATLIARTKSGSYQQTRLQGYYEDITRAFPGASEDFDAPPTARARLRYWFPRSKIRDLAKLLNSIRTVIPSRSHYRDFFECAFSNILKPNSRWLTKSIKPQVDPKKKCPRVLEAFEAQCTFMMKAFAASETSAVGRTQVLTANILLETTAPDTKVDMIVTSPPYVTSYEYADLHQLSALWLGFAADYRQLRQGSIGSTQYDLNLNREIKRLETTAARRVIFRLYDVDRATARSTAKYFIDMQAVSRRASRLLRKNGIALFVIGNTEYSGVHIENAEHLTESLLRSGFSRVRIAKRRMSGKILTPYRDYLGQFSRSATGRQVYSEEFVIAATR